jgi:predicted Zn-dependent peptidase
MTKSDNITYFTLPSGLRGVHVHIPRATVGYCGVAVRAGSRDEFIAAGEAGLAHFVEHTIFKGTQRRSSWHILNRMEAVGGELNAFTTKDDTVVYTVFPRGNVNRGLELVADLTLHSRFPAAELDKEREVVADEINSYLDSPYDAVFDDFEDVIFDGTPLGHNILGTTDTLANFDSEKCRSWIDRYYTANRMVVFYAGGVGAEAFIAKATQYFADVRPGEKIVLDPITLKTDVQQLHRNIDSHQAHTAMGTAFPAMSLSQRTTAALLSNILGGPGMNSLLNVDLRERRGLVYNVEASTTIFADCGEFVIYFGCDPHDTQRCWNLVNQNIQNLASHELSARKLAAAKKQYLGQLILANENRENRAISIARATLKHGTVLTRDQIIQSINAVTAADLRDMAAKFSTLSTLTLGPK